MYVKTVCNYTPFSLGKTYINNIKDWVQVDFSLFKLF